MELPEEFAQWRQDGVYETAMLADWFYKEAKEIAERFDKRNKSDYYMKNLQKA